MDATSAPSCDLTTAICDYTNKYSTLVTYSCLDQLGATKAERKAATTDYMALSNVWEFVYDFIPMYSGPIDNSTGLGLTRAKQLAKFDTIWRGDGLPTILGDDLDLRCDQVTKYSMKKREFCITKDGFWSRTTAIICSTVSVSSRRPSATPSWIQLGAPPSSRYRCPLGITVPSVNSSRFAFKNGGSCIQMMAFVRMRNVEFCLI